MPFRRAAFAILTAVVTMGTLASCALVAGIDGYGIVADGSASPSTTDAPGGGDAATTADGGPGEKDATDSSSTVTDSGGAADVIDAASLPPACDQNDPNLVLCFPFEGNANNEGSLAALNPIGLTYGPGQVGQGAIFDGTTSAITMAKSGSATLDAMTIFTVEAFVRPTVLPTIDGMRVGVVDSDGRFGLFILPTGFYCTGGGTATAPPVTLTVGTLVHLACVHDGATLTAYVDGVARVSVAVTPLVPASSSLAIGMNDPANDYLTGMMDEFRLYSRALSVAEIVAASKRGR